ncbi:partial Type A flavoprotein fprA, partial [Rhodocyclaceae bacterium]
MSMPPPPRPEAPVEIAPGVHWIGALDPDLRSFDIILKTAN